MRDEAHSKILIGLMVFAAIAFGVRFSEMIQKFRSSGSIQAYAASSSDKSLNALETAAGEEVAKKPSATTPKPEDQKRLEAVSEKTGAEPTTKTSEGHGKPEIEAPSLGDAPSKSAQWKDSGDLEDDYSDVKIEMFADLSKRRKDLESKEKELVMREALLKATQAELQQKTDELTKIKTDIETLLKQQTDQENKRIASLVKIYEGMKAKDAARIFDSLEMDVLLQVVTKMSERKTAPILAAMNPDRARNVTILLAEQNKLPDLPTLPSQ